MDRGYWNARVFFELLDQGADVHGTVKRMDWVPFTFVKGEKKARGSSGGGSLQAEAIQSQIDERLELELADRQSCLEYNGWQQDRQEQLVIETNVVNVGEWK